MDKLQADYSREKRQLERILLLAMHRIKEEKLTTDKPLFVVDNHSIREKGSNNNSNHGEGKWITQPKKLNQTRRV
jgi:hypothetical protein